MRLSQRAVFSCFFLVATLCIINSWEHASLSDSQNSAVGLKACESEVPKTLRSLKCSINGRISVGCYSIKKSTFAVDFEHIKYWYEVEGSLDPSDVTIFRISNSGNEAYEHPELNLHEPLGYYMGRQSWKNPDGKTYILLVDAEHNIPISHQWDSKGYPYPIQIAQCGFAYYAWYRSLQALAKPTSTASNKAVLDVKLKLARYLTCSEDGTHCFFGKYGDDLRTKVAVSRKLTTLLISGANWPRETRVIVYVLIPALSLYPRVQIHFACSADFGYGELVMKNAYWGLGLTRSGDLQVVHFLSSCENVSIMQDAKTIVVKAIASVARDPRARQSFPAALFDITLRSDVVVETVVLSYARKSSNSGTGLLRDFLLFARLDEQNGVYDATQLRVSSRFAWGRFIAAAQWLATNQAADGSWRVPTRLVFTRDIVLQPGWCSAMGQGQGISLLVRAASAVAEKEESERYLRAAVRALGPFNRSVAENGSSSGSCGVRAHFLGQSALPWNEEHPATSSVFVLNGFIFSLIGLFDLTKAPGLTGSDLEVAQALLDEGLSTLVRVLPLFDSGTGSFYDLRHLSLAHALRKSPQIPEWDPSNLEPLLKTGPNRARWQYHRVHLEQLHQLANVVAPQHAALWQLFFDRWMAYVRGFRSGHN